MTCSPTIRAGPGVDTVDRDHTVTALEKKGYVESDKSQFAFVFRALVSREDVMRSRMNDLAGELCDGDVSVHWFWPLPSAIAFCPMSSPVFVK